MQDLTPVWELDSIFSGGSASAALGAWLERLSGDIAALQGALPSPGNTGQWPRLIALFQDIAARLNQASAFISCLQAQDVEDEQARLLVGRLQGLEAALLAVTAEVDERMLAIAEAPWQRLLALPELAPVAFSLEERRTAARKKLPAAQERLVNDLAVDGYHGWAEQYRLIAGGITVPWTREGEEMALSTGQAANMLADPDPAIRAAMADEWERAWAREAPMCAAVLNHLSGFRLNLYRRRGWDDILQEPLADNRLSAETLRLMWDAVERNKEIFVRYLERKKRLLGLERISWYDLGAPLGKTDRQYTFTRACHFVMEQLAVVSPKMAHFCARAFQQRWVEAEDRPGKRAGAFCSDFPVNGESRVFMTFGGSLGNVATLAHELGHAYHHHVLVDLPFMARDYPPCLAETASIFAETVVMDAAVSRAANRRVKAALLDEKVKNSISFLMDIHGRFLFETAFYERRRQGPVSVGELNNLMLEAQRKAFRNSLDRYHAQLWCSKLHFYLTRVPFYNFPYTFGYLFSSGIQALARAEPAAFEERYIGLLRDTGRMNVEALAEKHLGVDLGGPSFWQRAVGMAAEDAAEFLRLTE